MNYYFEKDSGEYLRTLSLDTPFVKVYVHGSKLAWRVRPRGNVTLESFDFDPAKSALPPREIREILVLTAVALAVCHGSLQNPAAN
jgi:hypothetical protein